MDSEAQGFLSALNQPKRASSGQVSRSQGEMTASGEHKGTCVLSSCAGLGFSLALNPSAPNHQ